MKLESSAGFPALRKHGPLRDSPSPETGSRFWDLKDVLAADSPHLDRFEELAVLSHERDRHVELMTRIAHWEGVSGIDRDGGAHPARNTFFELYSPYLDLALHQTITSFGQPDEACPGQAHFLLHDLAHNASGQPGIRLKDLEDPSAAKEQLVRVFLRKEALASAWSGLHYAKPWYQYRYERDGGKDPATFARFNRGTVSLSDVSPSRFLDFADSIRSGNPRHIARVVRSLVDPAFIRGAVEAGVPQPVNPPRGSFAPNSRWALHGFVMKNIFPGAYAHLYGMRHEDVGYYKQISWADDQAEFYLTPAYAAWAEKFEWGTPLDELEASIDTQYKNFRAGDFFHTDIPEPPAGMFDAMFLRNEVAMFGRKLVDLQHVAPDAHSELVADLLEHSVRLNRQLLALKKRAKPVSQSQLAQARATYNSLTARAAASIRLSDAVPREQQHGFYHSEMWRDPFTPICTPKNSASFFEATDSQ